MNLVEWLMLNRDKLALAKELAATAKENARLRDEVHALQHELFWLKAKEKNENPQH